MTTDEALRTAPIIPACLTLFTGLILLLCKDSPKGNYKELKDKGVMIEVSVFASLRDGLLDFNTYILFIQYACCFGAEVTMLNAAVLHLREEFMLTTDSASAIATFSGWRPLFQFVARTIGGCASDKLNMKKGMKGRLIWQMTCLFITGVTVLIFRITNSLGVVMIILYIFYFFAQAAQGSTYAIVPYIQSSAVGTVAGVVGAGGYAGTIAFGMTFSFRELPSMAGAFNIMSALTIISAALTFLVYVKDHRRIVGGTDSDAVKGAWQRESTAIIKLAY